MADRIEELIEEDAGFVCYSFMAGRLNYQNDHELLDHFDLNRAEVESTIMVK